MLTFKGTKGQKPNTKVGKTLSKPMIPNLLEVPKYPTMLPNNTEIPHNYSLLVPPQLSVLAPQQISQMLPADISKTLTFSSGKNNNNNIMKISDTINIVFDSHTGNLKEIISIMQDDTDIGNTLAHFNIPIPELIKWLNRNHIILYSRKVIGTLLIIDSKEFIDEYPDCVSCILFEKVNINDNFDIKVVVNLKYEDRFITKSELLDVILTNINNFWIIIKQDDDIHLINYYKSKRDVVVGNNCSDYLYSVFIIKDSKFICSMWTIYDIVPDVINLFVLDDEGRVSIQQYTTGLDNNNNLIIELYSVDTRFYGCGKYLNFCANYNISILSLLFELENKEKHFYTGMMSLTQPDINQRTKIKLEFSQKTILSKEISDIESRLIIYNIIEKTEVIIIKQEKIRSQEIVNEKKKYMANKKLENAKKELDRREKEAKDIADKLLEEEENSTFKKKKIQLKKNKDKEKQKTDKLVQEKIAQEKLVQEKLVQEKLAQEKLAQEKLEQEKLEQEKLAQEKLEQEKIAQEKLEQEKLAQEKLEKAKIEQAKIVQEKLEKDKIKKVEPKNHKKLILKTKKIENKKSQENTLLLIPSSTSLLQSPSLLPSPSPTPSPLLELLTLLPINSNKTNDNDNDTKKNNEPLPDYYMSNDIELKTTPYSLYYMFIHYMNMINPVITNELVFAQSSQHYNDLLFINRFYIMYAIDILIINHKDIINLKKIIDLDLQKEKDKNFNISAIYGSYLPILYSFILNEIGFLFNPFNKNIDINPFDKLKDYDTLVLKLLDDYNETHYNNEFIRDQSFLIGYNSVDGKPITKTKIQSSSIHNLICHCWDLNYTSAILIYEDNKQPYIMRNPDFTEFLFGQQPIQLLFGKNETNLYNYDITRKRLEKAFNTWY